jgi:rhodanese-related sulfurtransferase
VVDAPEAAGEPATLTPRQAWDLLSADPGAALVDVRTRAEWSYVGVPDLGPLGRAAVLVEWVGYPDGEPNPAFLDELAAAGVETAAPVLFLCRSGVRSKAAAAAARSAGYAKVYNVTEGFEGPLDGAQHRGGAGWKAAGLPWRQS